MTLPPDGAGTAMKIVIEFYRTRDADDAHAVVGRVGTGVLHE